MRSEKSRVIARSVGGALEWIEALTDGLPNKSGTYHQSACYQQRVAMPD
jgi:hypothetical protein